MTPTQIAIAKLEQLDLALRTEVVPAKRHHAILREVIDLLTRGGKTPQPTAVEGEKK